MRALKEVIDYAAVKGLLVILDGKRNDIGSTATGYAEAYLGTGSASPWGCDGNDCQPLFGRRQSDGRSSKQPKPAGPAFLSW